MKKLYSSRLIKFLAVAAIFGLLVFLNPKNIFNPVRYAFARAVYPFQKISYSVSYKIMDTKDFLASIGQLKKENEGLNKQNQELLAENSRLKDVDRENSSLREQLGLLPRDKFNLEAAQIISQDQQGFGNWIEIDKGSNSGIKEGMAVIVSKGVIIGKVQEVSAGVSKVMLLTNAKSAVGVVVSETGAKGIAKGEFGLGLLADAILQTDPVSVGNEVVTSGVGGDVPRGLFVGTVQEIRPSEDHLFRQAVLASPVDASKLETVFVIMGSKQ